MKRHHVAAITLALSLTGLTGCASPSAETPPAVSVSAEPTMSIKEAGETYTKLSAASNAAREKWMNAPAPTKANLARHKKLAAGAAKATTAFSKGLRKNQWPSDVQTIIDALDEHLQERAAAYQRAAKAETVTAYLTAAQEIPVTTSLTAQLRTALGLPESPIVQGVTPR
ncbi:hypothetical protein Q0Z83_032620 [Actinoplanes sichuanensis]|uniref:Lipoprotein n=1 Tax=Actinoplanes sichuanensis TaxID=512349 RepID=A0ABW4AR17_9ACTN|nr:hypothetical protein [Actinoplanes sichuanensis]BEL05071.1 hypothetical protein Q0Z83_032620 [Actinoplanes sichuanensis]